MSPFKKAMSKPTTSSEHGPGGVASRVDEPALPAARAGRPGAISESMMSKSRSRLCSTTWVATRIALAGRVRRSGPEYSSALRLSNSSRFGVRADRPGSLLFDFHTVRGVLPSADGKTKGSPANPYTIVSQRAYLQDASFLAALEGEPELLRECQSALQRPVWPCYLGRKSFPPSLPPLIGIVTSGLESALREHPDFSNSLKNPVQYIVQESTGGLVRPDQMTGRPSREFRQNRYQLHLFNREDLTNAS